MQTNRQKKMDVDAYRKIVRKKKQTNTPTRSQSGNKQVNTQT